MTLFLYDSKISYPPQFVTSVRFQDVSTSENHE